jgi:hypothetical protein
MTRPDALDPAQRLTARGFAIRIIRSGLDPAAWLAEVRAVLDEFAEIDAERVRWPDPGEGER